MFAFTKVFYCCLQFFKDMNCLSVPKTKSRFLQRCTFQIPTLSRGFRGQGIDGGEKKTTEQ